MDTRKILSHAEEVEQTERDYRDHNLSDLSSLEKILFEAIDILEASTIPYALIGGVAAQSLGRPRITHDIDLFVRPDDAEKVLRVLEEKEFICQKRDPVWLYKAWKEEILVDIIFKSSGDIYFDEEVRSHVRRMSYQGRHINAISPEDLIVIKAAAHQEHNPHHWHDALAVLKQGNIEWDYFLKRARHAPRRILSLLIYGQSNDIAIPNDVIQRLYRSIFDLSTYAAEPVIHPYRNLSEMPETSEEGIDSPIYIKGRIMEALTMDERIAENDVKIYISGNTVVAKGEVFTEEQMEALNEVIQGMIPENLEFKNLVNVRVVGAPEGSEAIT